MFSLLQSRSAISLALYGCAINLIFFYENKMFEVKRYIRENLMCLEDFITVKCVCVSVKSM